MKKSFIVFTSIAFAVFCLGECVKASDEAHLKELLQEIKGSSHGQVDEKLRLDLAEQIKNFTGTDAELEFIRGFGNFLFNYDWFNADKWKNIERYVDLLSPALTRYSCRKMDKSPKTSFKAIQAQLSGVHKEMLICLDKLEEKKADAILRGNFNTQILVKSITELIEDQQRVIVLELATNVHNMCAFEGRTPTVEDLKAIGLKGDFLSAAIKEVD